MFSIALNSDEAIRKEEKRHMSVAFTHGFIAKRNY
jgi:hypothetical protein